MSISIALHHHHTGIFVSDLNRSLAWYDEILGFKLLHRQIITLPYLGEVEMAFIRNGEVALELYNAPKAAPFTMENYVGTLGTKHLCLIVDHESWDEFKKHIYDKGLVVMDDRCHKGQYWWNDGNGFEFKLEKPEDAPDYEGCHVMYFQDPDHIPIEIQDGYYPRKD